MGRGKKRDIQYDSSSEEEVEDKSHLPPLVRKSDEAPPLSKKWTNRQRLLILCSRGMTARNRHFIKDLIEMMPHSKTESKFELKSKLTAISEIAESRNCNKVLYFEARKRCDMFMWMSDINGCSAKFQIMNLHTMAELNMTGNCLRTSRPLLKFSMHFNDKSKPHLRVMKEMITQTFGTPRYHPKSQPFCDHVFSFTWLDDKIWFRNYQILQEDGEMAEIGPRFVMNPIKILENSFCGSTWYSNPKYRTPNKDRQVWNMVDHKKGVDRERQMDRREKNTDNEPWKAGAELVDL